MSALTQERLKELLEYNPETGLFVRLIGRSGPNARVGDVAGCDNGKGYIRIYVDGTAYKGHRLAWFYVYGEWPAEIDHINGDKSDNRLANLRSVTRSQNRMNVGAYKSNGSGYRGVNFDKATGKWKAQIQRDGRKRAIGYFGTPEDAKAAYDAEAERLHGEYRRAA